MKQTIAAVLLVRRQGIAWLRYYMEKTVSRDNRLQFSLVLRHRDLIVRDHRLFQIHTLPGVAYVDILLRYLENRDFDLDSLQLKDISLTQPLSTSPEFDLKLRLTLEKNGAGWSVRACSQKIRNNQPLEPDWQENMQGEVCVTDSLPVRRIDIASLKTGAIAVHDFDRTYEPLRATGIDHYQFMKLNGCIYEGRDYLLADVSLSDLAQQCTSFFCMQPALLDGAICLMGILMDAEEKRTFVPAYFGSFQARRRLPERCLILLRKQRDIFKSETDIAYLDIDLYDELGQRIAALRKLGLLQVRATEATERPALSTGKDTNETATLVDTVTARSEPVNWRAEVITLVEQITQRPLKQAEESTGFYDLGLDSQNLLELVKVLEGKIGGTLYPTLLFEHNTIEKLTAYLQTLDGDKTASTHNIGPAQMTDSSQEAVPPSLSLSQQPTEDPCGDFCYLPTWVEQSPAMEAPGSDEEILVVYTTATEAMRDLLAGYHGSICEILLGDRTLQRSAKSWAVDVNDERAIARSIDSMPRPQRVYYLGTLFTTPADPLDKEELARAQSEGLLCLFRLLKAFDAAKYGGARLLLKVVTTDTRRVDVTDVVYPHSAAVHGFLRTVAQEYVQWQCCCVDLDVLARRRSSQADCWEAWTKWIVSETGAVVAYRDEKRFLHTFQPLPTDAVGPTPVRNGGVYLITGAGGIAQALALELAKRFAARIVLVGRSQIDAARRQALSAIEAVGGHALYLRGDVTDEAAMARVVASVRARFGSINGVFHLPFVLRDRMLTNMDEGALLEVLSPKVEGSINLVRALRGTQLDFFIFFSSALGHAGSIGQANYTAASSYEDALAHALDRRLDYPVQSIDWGYWGEAGGVATDEYRISLRERGLYSIQVAEGMAVLHRVLSTGAPQVLAAKASKDTLRAMGVRLDNTSSTDVKEVKPLLPSTEMDATSNFKDDPIAVIGLAGRYPEARNIDEFWDNLCHGKDCTTEIPAERWSLQGFYDPVRGKRGCSYSKWGGFIEDVDRFDPLFFNISPADAELMDPQERLFLETVWHTLEDAGYTRRMLADASVGVFVGCMWSQYQLYALEAGVRGQMAAPSSIPASIANRTSFYFDFKGPSVAIDTMCSASLSAIHYACESIRRGDCELAVAGGVNVSIHPHKYLFLSETRLISSDSHCHSFGAGGDGYVPGEGVGAVLLKPLSKALADGDRIHGLIKGSAIGHSGRTGGYMVPDPQAQARTIIAALRAADVAPGSINYIEAQGIGSELGDPIEVAGLVKAFADVGRQSCAIGSVKSNIGHLESAAGVAALTKVLLQMKHHTLVPSLHADPPNPNIDFAATPFYVQRSLSEWRAGSAGETSAAAPRRAAISAFGAGGSNAQIIVEEYRQQTPVYEDDRPHLIVLSARDGERLQASAVALAKALETKSDLHLSEIAWTLQAGREAMEARLALVVSSLPELVSQLAEFCHGEPAQGDDYRGAADDGRSSPGEPEKALSLHHIIANRDLDKLGRLWVNGMDVDWSLLYAGEKPRRVSLPGYPFARERCWILPTPLMPNPGEASEQSAFPASREPAASVEAMDMDQAQRFLRDEVVRLVSETLKIKPEQISLERSFSEYGLSSVSGVALIQRLNDTLGITLKTTVLYDYANVAALADHILQHHKLEMAAVETTAQLSAAQTALQQHAVARTAPMVEAPAAAGTVYHALQFSKPGNVDDIEIVPLQPRAPEDDEVQVLVKAFSLNFGDLLGCKGLYPTMPDYPFTPGFEFSGVVLETGRKVTRVACGDEVVGLTGRQFGGHSQIVTTLQHLVAAKPANVSHEEACAFPIVYLTMHDAFARAQLQPGEKVLIQTAAGGVGLIAVQMALAKGAEIFATAGSPAKLEYLRRLGVHHTINYRQEDFAERIRELTDGAGVDVVINTLSGDAMQKGLDILAPWGRYVEIAMTALKFFGKLDLSRLVRNQSIFSIDLRRLLLERPERMAGYLDAMVETLRTGRIKPTVGKVFPFEQALDAYRWLEARENIGKVVVTADAPEPALSVTDSPQRLAAQTADEMEIAIVGLSGRFPGARNLEAYWRNLAEGRDSVTEVPTERWSQSAWYDPDPGRLDKTYCPWGGFLDDIERFDPLFFNMSGKEARLTDPAQRLFLQECWNALEVAGFDVRKLSGAKCGVFVGTLAGDYRDRMGMAGVAEAAQSFWGNAGSVLASRIAYFLNLNGPALAIDTACSSSLVAVHMACQSLRTGECEMALAGGVHVGTTPHLHVVASNAEMLSPSGRCRTFDEGADGFVPGEGVGAIVLKPLAAACRDGDHVYGVIRGSGINQDGRTNGITAPSTLSQTELLSEVYRRYEIDPSTIGYVEAHGTGTKLGDPIEVEALTNAFRRFTDRRGFCPIGSVKSNIGHAIAAAGIAGVIKILLALEHRQLPPSLHISRESEHIDFAGSPFYPLKTLQAWPAGSTPRRAAVSSFGFSGTNAHLVIEEPPPMPSPLPEAGNPYYLIPLSAKTDAALERRLGDLHDWLKRQADRHRLADVAYTLSAGRVHFDRRCAFVVCDLDELRQAIDGVRRGRYPDSYRWCDTGRAAVAEAIGRTPSLENHNGANSPAGRERLLALAQAYVGGQEPAWSELFPAGCRRSLRLPTYPFAQERYWIDLPERGEDSGPPPEAGSDEDLLKGYLYAPYWEAEARPGAEFASGRALIVYATGGEKIAAALRALHGDAVELFLGETTERQAPQRWQAGLDDPGAYTRMLREIGEIDVVYHLAGTGLLPPKLDSLEAGENRCVISLFRLAKALAGTGFRDRPLILKTVTSGASAVLPGETANPLAASLWGFARSLAKECPDWRVSCIDVAVADKAEKVAAAIAAEAAPRGGEAVAWRGSERYVRKISPIDLSPACETRFKTRGVYLILGGAGGVGQAFSRYLAERFNARLALVGRSPSAPDAAIADIEAAGGEVIYLQADLTDPLAVHDALAQVKRRFGHIDGVIHSAMVFAPVPLAALEELQLRDTLAPKVRGTLALVEALQGERLDFLLFFSSAQSFTGNAGRAHYAAACTFQDAFASDLRGRTPYPVQIVNWGFWATNQGRISDALHRSTQEEEGAYPLTPEEGSEAVRRALGHNAAQLLVLHVREHVLKLMGIEMATRLRLAPPSSGSLIEAIAAVPPPEIDAAALARGMEALSRFGAYALLHAFRRMGVQFRPGLELEADGLKRKLGVVAHYDRLFEALLGVLEESGHITRAGGLIRATERIDDPETLEALRDLDACATQTVQAHPGVAAYVKLVRTCLADYPEILRGSVKATDVIFPGSSMDLVGPIYGDNPLADYANELVAQAVSLYIERRLPGLAPGRRIRILEIGAGTGGTTRPLLERIGRYGDYLEYLYTDLSLAFTRYGNRAYGERFPFLQFRTFDIELPIESQGLTPGRYDLILASNVMHATRRIRATLQQAKALLAGNGWLILNELTYTHNFSTLTFGTLDGWWLFEDPALRMPASPLLDTRTWRRLLGEQGFVGTLVRGAGEGSDAIVGQHVLIAQSDGLLKLGGSATVPGAVPALVDATPVPAPPSSRGEAEAVVASLVSLAAQVLQIPATAVDIRTPLMDLGLDSLLAQDLVKRINRQFDIPLTPTTLFDHATLARLGDHIGEAYGHRFSSAAIPDHGIAEGGEAEKAQSVVPENQSPAPVEPHAGDIAVVGVACRFPGARTAAQFWGCLAEGRDLVDEIRRWPLQAFYDPDPALHDRSYCKHGGLLSGIDEFDPLFFSLSPKQAELMDPRQRLFLQEAWSALEDAGYSPQALAGKRCGVFVGCEGSSDYFTEIRRESEAFGAEYFLGNSNSILAARIAYYLDLKGPSITIDTACSSSLVALHLACESIRHGESDMALAGGVMIMTRPDAYIPLSRMGMLSPQGKCRAFDAGADGFVPAEGVGVTLLKPLAQAQADGDQIYGVIKATGINQDGKTNGITAPSAASQAELERWVYARFAIDPTTISYVEAHGTGTQLGDPVEFEALKSVYGRATDRRQFCALGSVKTNMGHAGAAAGVAGLIKVLLAMRHRLLPPSLHFERANEQIDFETSPFYLNTGLRAWTGERGQPLRAAVSSFGHSGTNAHAVIEEAPAELSAHRQELPFCLIPLSAKSEASLRQRAVDLRQWIEGEGAAHSLSDIAFTLQVGRGHFPWRLVFLVSRTQGLLTGLEQWLQAGSTPQCWSGGPQAQGSDRIPPATPAGGDIDALRPWAEAYAGGMELNWQALWPSRRRRISLPTYPFSRERFWLPPSAVPDAPRSEMLSEPVLRPERDPSRGGGIADGRFLPEVVLEKPGGEVPDDETLLSLFGRLERGEIELAEAEQSIEAGGSA